MKIIQAWTHKETGIGTYTIVGLGDDGNIYEWKIATEWTRSNNEDWKPKNKVGWVLREGKKPKD